MEQATGLLTSERFAVYRTVLSVLGAVYLLKVFLKALWTLSSGFCAYFLAPFGISRMNITKYGSWAVVTGASEGIGRAYAVELAKQGLNVAIMSRSEDKLRQVADEIERKYGKEVRFFSVDFSKGQSVYEDIQAEISDLDIAILVNNVGLSAQFPNFFGEVDKMMQRNIIEVNCQSMVQMTHLVLPKMVEKNGGIIVNVSSGSALVPTPLLSVYAATKKFVQYFSDGLRYEYKSKGIIVQTVYPGLVATSMSGIKRPTISAPSPEKYAASAVATIGIQRDTHGYLIHSFQLFFLTSIPRWLAFRLLFKILMGTKIEYEKRLSQKKD